MAAVNQSEELSQRKRVERAAIEETDNSHFKAVVEDKQTGSSVNPIRVPPDQGQKKSKKCLPVENKNRLSKRKIVFVR